MSMTAAQFLARPPDPLRFYDILPSDGIDLRDMPPLGSADALASALLAQTDLTIGTDLVDSLLLLVARDPAALDAALATRLADHASLLYAALLAGGKRDRVLRMKLQQLNFFLRDSADRDVPEPQGTSTIALDGAGPWDWLPLDNGSMAIFSGQGGLQWQAGETHGQDNQRFYSQLDTMPDGSISVGSIFSPGCTLFEQGRLRSEEHGEPIVLAFSHAGEARRLTYAGTIVGADGSLIGRLAAGQVDRVRLLDGCLFVSDWSHPGEILVHDLASAHERWIALEGIILLNDICVAGERYYAICKQQGRVFSYDRNLRPLGTRLRFGRGPGRLFDPITIRHHAGQLHVLNWVSATRVSLPPF